MGASLFYGMGDFFASINRIRCFCFGLSSGIFKGFKMHQDHQAALVGIMKIFVYATLKNHPTLGHVLHHMPKTRDVRLDGYRESFHKSWPTLVKDPESSIKGQEFDVSKVDEKHLDAWENHYARHMVTLTDGSQAYAYILDPTTLRGK